METERSRTDFTETHILGDETRQLVVRANTADPRAWLAKLPVAPGLADYQIAHVGVVSATVPFRMVRTRQSGTYFLACFGGEGRILVDGRWQKCPAGMACLLPPHILNAFHAVENLRWEFAYVRYQPTPEQRPIVSSSSPVLAKFDAEPIRAAVQGLYHEARGDNAPVLAQHWVELIQGYVLRFAQPWQREDRLRPVWEKVAANLAEPWDLAQLSRLACMSSEHLRRLCHRQLGRSPMHQVIQLRMRKAAELLATTPDKIETIALAVGYANQFAFSDTFKKWTGWRPSEFPGRRVPGMSPPGGERQKNMGAEKWGR